MASLLDILRSDILINFLYPFLLIFFILFAVLEKTKILGENKSQINAFLSLVISLLFVIVNPSKNLLNNLVLFLAISLVVIFVLFLLFGFVSKGDKPFELGGGLKTAFQVAVVVAFVIFILSVTDVSGSWTKGISTFFSSVSSSFWADFLMVIILAGALAAVLKKGTSA